MKAASYHRLYDWYEREKRVLPWRETTDPYCIWLSEIILQQTRVQQGMEYYERFVERWPTVADLAAAPEDEVMRMWQGLGYYSRARNLHKAAQTIAAAPPSDGASGVSFPRTYEQVLALPGVGEYTAGAICSFAYDMPYPAADGNVYRVLSRLMDDDTPFDTAQGKKRFRQYAWTLLDKEHARLFNSAIMELGALHCTPTGMDCAHCPLMSECRACANGTAELLPVRKARPKVRDRWMTYVMIEDAEHCTYIRQRMEKDIWQHLYELPMTESDHLLTQQEVEQHWGVSVVAATPELTHVLSHQRIHAIFYRAILLPATAADAALTDCDAAASPLAGYKRISLAELDDYALSRLTLRGLGEVASGK